MNDISRRRPPFLPRAAHAKPPADTALGGGPTFFDLLAGKPMTASPEAAGADLATWLLENHVDRGVDHVEMGRQLQKLACLQTPGTIAAAADACRDAASTVKVDGKVFAAAALLFDFYGAASGGAESARKVATHAVGLADASRTTEDQALEVVIAALGWLAVAASEEHDGVRMAPIARASAASERVFDRVMRAWRRRLQACEPVGTHRDPGNGLDDVDWPFGELASEVAGGSGKASTDPCGVVVVCSIGGTGTTEGRRIATAFASIVDTALPLVPTPDLVVVRRDLLRSYPHAEAAIDGVVEELVGRDHVRLPPIVLVGPPGTGKTRLATDLLGKLGIPATLYPCGGNSDSSLAGTGRRWVTGEPSLPVAMLDTHRVASPGIILDELEKAGTGTQNGRLVDALLGMLEPSSSAQWLDPYLQAPVDLSHVVWIATANSLEGIPVPLRDRCRILRVPAPSPEHLPVLSGALLRQAVVSRGLDPRWAAPLDGIELRAVSDAWPGGSLRRLARLLDGVLSARNQAPVLQ